MRISENSTRRTTYLPNNPVKKNMVEEECSKPSPEDAHTQEAEDVKGDLLELSAEATQRTKDINDELQEMSDKLKDFTNQLEVARKQSQSAAKSWEILIKCLKIAMRIMSGDIVPRADHKYIAKHEPEMYSKALTMRMNKEDPKKHKRLSKKEDESEKTEKQDSMEKDSKAINTLVPALDETLLP